jgi:nicotinamide phosphoribosyltransferase
MYPKGTEKVYSTWIPRASRYNYIDEVVAFGFQQFLIKLNEIFRDHFFLQTKAAVVAEYARTIKFTLGVENPCTSHIEALHDLGYLPIHIKALDEGTLVPLRVPMLTIENTLPEFFWVTNYIESYASCELWQATTSATLAHEFRKLLDGYALLTVGNTDFVQFQGHDFAMRGMSSLDSAITSGMGHLLSFVGTDTIPAINAAEYYYGANIEEELIGTSIPASEHSIQCTYEDDYEYLRTLLEDVHPNGFVSIVSDGYDFWDVIGRVLPALKDKIMARSGGPVGDRVVIRPDSGDPVLIVCGDPKAEPDSLEFKGAVEALWDIFGGTVSEQGYKVLDPHIGLIYGDAISIGRCREICDRLAAKGFASTNCVYGIGSYTYQYNTRDTFGFALKSTLAVIRQPCPDGCDKGLFRSEATQLEGGGTAQNVTCCKTCNGEGSIPVEKPIWKDPKTDDGTKKSMKGKVMVFNVGNGGKIWAKDGYNLDAESSWDLLHTIYLDGKLVREQTFSQIRAKLNG